MIKGRLMPDVVLSRRQALVGVAAAVGTALVGAPAASAAAPVFTLGVASGDPPPDGVVLWTRLVVEADRAIPVGWQVAEDERFRRVVRSGVALARPELAHSVHVDVRGLRPNRQHFYRFRAGADLSPVGRTRTTGSDERLRLGVVSCQDFQNGYWPAYLGLAEEDLDVVLHLGDYIYENDPGSAFADRVHTTPEAPGAANTAGTLTGTEQEAWLTAGLVDSPARWNVVAQQVMMARTRLPNPYPPHVPPTVVNLDQWDGYQPQRERLLRFVEQAGVANPVFLAGDIHSTWVNELKTDFDDLAAAPVAAEFVGTSISSSFPAAFDGPIKAANPTLNPHVRYFDGLKHGYLRCEVDRDRWLTDVRVVDTVDVRESPTTTAASFVVEAGSSVVHRV